MEREACDAVRAAVRATAAFMPDVGLGTKHEQKAEIVRKDTAATQRRRTGSVKELHCTTG